MTGQTPRSTSLRSRSRQWTTVACIGAAVLALWALNGQHYLHGGLSMVAALILFKQSSLAHRSRASSSDIAASALSSQRTWRKAA